MSSFGANLRGMFLQIFCLWLCFIIQNIVLIDS